MSFYCPTCQVKITSRVHQCVFEKECQVCHQVKKVAEFPVHASSWDGHKHTCIPCWTAKKEQEKASHRQHRLQQEQQRQQRTKDNILFRAYGYRWKKEMIEAYEEWEEEWVLYSPSGMKIIPHDALQEIAQLQVHKPGHPSALWAKEMIDRPNVVVLDTETTGLGNDDEIIEIAVVELQGRSYSTLVQCQRLSIPEKVKAISHINEYMLRGAPTFPSLWDKLMRYLVAREIIIYNAEYDLRMLRQTADRYHLEMPELHTHCLMKQYASYVGHPSFFDDGYRFFKLDAACIHFHVEQMPTHRAISDAQAAIHVIRALAAHAYA